LRRQLRLVRLLRPLSPLNPDTPHDVSQRLRQQRPQSNTGVIGVCAPRSIVPDIQKSSYE